MNIKWSKLSLTGLKGDLAKGVSASYGALLNGQLIVAGGANFPGEPGYKGGAKALYTEIVRWDEIKNKWEIVGQLPHPSAYGVSVSISDGALWLGGNTPDSSLANTYKITLGQNNSVQLEPWIDLPYPMDNFAGCALEHQIFVAGGNVAGTPSNQIYSYNTHNDSGWQKLPDFPGSPRVQPVMAAVKVDDRMYVYLLGGFFGGNDREKPSVATDVLRLDVEMQQWEKVAEQSDSVTNELFSLGGATAMSVKNRYIVCLGGVNYHVFLDALSRLHNIAHNEALSSEEKKQLNYEFSDFYMNQPIDYYNFNRQCRVFDTYTKIWSTVATADHIARAGATLVYEKDSFYVIQGELKPGVRSPQTWKGTFSAD